MAILIIALSAVAVYLLKALAPEAAVAPRKEALPAVNVITVDALIRTGADLLPGDHHGPQGDKLAVRGRRQHRLGLGEV